MVGHSLCKTGEALRSQRRSKGVQIMERLRVTLFSV